MADEFDRFRQQPQCIRIDNAARQHQGDRFRHGTRLLRWRPDKAPKQCSLDQVKQKKANLLALLD